MDEKPFKYENLPIPSYEEATSSRPASSQSRGPQEISDDAERQGLLNTRRNYEPPRVESQRSSLDSLDGIEVESEAEVRREMQEMDIEDPNTHRSSRSLLTYRFKAFTNFTNSFPSISLPSFRRILPKIDWQAVDANRIVIIGRMFGILLIMGLLYVLVASDILSFGKNRMGMGGMFDPESVRAFVQGGWRERAHIEHHLKHITKFPHLAGTEGNYVLGEWVAEMFKGHRLEDVAMERFDVHLNYPVKGGREVAIVEPQEQKWTAEFEEDGEETLAFHGHSATGDATGPLIYANFGSRDDFKYLQGHGISVAGAVVLVRYYGTPSDPGSKILAAQEAGASGVIMYSDPAQDGMVQGPEYPNGRFMPQDGVQRTSVSLMSRVIGDVLSPGWASTPGNTQRLNPEDSKALVMIPSVPISWRDATHLLASLQDHGNKMDAEEWIGAPNTEYWTGDQNSPKVRVKNQQDIVREQPIYNVIGKIVGWEQPKQKIIVGNHRDAWCLGAADPGSGTSVMIAMTKIFGALRKLQWRPLRTIEFVSWDAGEYNAAGSTEHVENRIEELRQSGIAYLNVDAGVTGIDFHAAASPLYDESLRRVLGRVSDPYSNKTIREIWEANDINMTPVAAEGDCTPFQYITGTSSINLGFKGEHYPKGSCYDNYDWMSRFGDQGAFDYSAALGEIWALLILDMADAPLLPFDLEKYIETIAYYVDVLDQEFPFFSTTTQLDTTPLHAALTNLRSQASHVSYFDQEWRALVYTAGGYETLGMTNKRLDRNNRVAKFEKNLMDIETSDGGLENRKQYKHLITAPKLWDPSQVDTFPSIRQWTDIGDWTRAQQEVERVAGFLENAAKDLYV